VAEGTKLRLEHSSHVLCWGLVAVCVVSGLELGPAATNVAAGVRFTADVRPQSLTWPGTRFVRYSLRISAGERGEVFSVLFQPPLFAGEGSVFPPSEHGLRVRGPARLGPRVTAQGSLSCSPRIPLIHGYEVQTQKADVSLPARSHATLSTVFSVGTFAPWPGADLRGKFVVSPRLVAGGPSTLSSARVFRPPRPALAGVRGVRITTHTRPASYTWGKRPTQAIERTSELMIYGKARGVPRGYPISLKVTTAAKPRLRTIAVLRTASRGRFSYRWTPRSRGLYEVWAFTPAQGRRARDFACPRVLRVR